MLLKKIKRANLGFNKVFSIFSVITFLFLGVVLTAYFISIQKKTLNENLREKGSLIVKSLARGSALGIVENDKSLIRKMVQSVAHDEEIRYAEIYGIDMEPLARSGAGEHIPVWVKDTLFELNDEYEQYLKEKNIYEKYYPVIVEEQNAESDDSINKDSLIERMVGIARVGITTEYIQKKLFNIAFKSIVLTVCVMLGIGLIINYFVNVQIVQPLRKLTLAAVTVSHGDLRQEVDADANNEVGILARAFNLMVHDLRESKIKLEQNIYKLDDKVKERTKKLEEDIEDLRVQNKSLQNFNKVNSHFIADIFRELRSPLMSIQGYASTLLRHNADKSNEKNTQYLHIIESETERLSRLFKNLFVLSQIASGDLSLQKKEVNCADMISRVIALVQEQFKHVTFKTDCESADCTIEADEMLLEQVLIELCINAAIYSPSGGIVTVSCEKDELRVIDSGFGIPVDEKEKVFKKFHRGDNEGTKNFAGSGVGLTVARSIVYEHGGDIEIGNTPGGGTTIIVKM